MKHLVTLAVLLVAFAGTLCAQIPRRVPLVGYVDRSGKVVEPAVWEHGSTGFRGDWVAVSKGGRSGFLNLRTRASTGLLFDSVLEDHERARFADGPEPVQIGRKWGFVDERGEVAIPPQFDFALGFGPDGLAIVEVADSGGFPRCRGFIDRSGRLVVPARYEMLWPYSGGLAVFRQGEKWGAIDREGREVVPPRFGSLGFFGDNGLAPASLKGRAGREGSRFGYVDRTGRFVIPQRFVHAGSFNVRLADGERTVPDGLALVVLTSGESAYIDSSGNIVARFRAGLNVFGVSPNRLVRIQDRSNAKYGFADTTGAIVIPPRFGQAGGFDSNGLAVAEENGKYGYIRADGSWAIEPRFSGAGSFNEFGQAQAEEDGASVLIDRTGRVAAKLEHGGYFYWQRSDYAAFRIYPPRLDYPPEQFGRWVLERSLYEVPKSMDLYPTPTSSIRLTFRTTDGLVRWGLRTEGWTVDVFTEEGPEKESDKSSQNRLLDVPTGSDLIAMLGRQLRGAAEFSVATTPGKAEDQAVQRERLRQVAAGRSGYLAELAESKPDLDRALEAMRAAVKEQYGKMSGPPCPPSQCQY